MRFVHEIKYFTIIFLNKIKFLREILINLKKRGLFEINF